MGGVITQRVRIKTELNLIFTNYACLEKCHVQNIYIEVSLYSNPGTVRTVSYTHLDVYKRQPQNTHTHTHKYTVVIKLVFLIKT